MIKCPFCEKSDPLSFFRGDSDVDDPVRNRRNIGRGNTDLSLKRCAVRSVYWLHGGCQPVGHNAHEDLPYVMATIAIIHFHPGERTMLLLCKSTQPMAKLQPVQDIEA